MKRELKKEKFGQTSQSACDALFAYFYDLGMTGDNAKIDYYFINNLLTGEGGE